MNLQFYAFLVACRGSWRNSFYIKSQQAEHPSHLLAFDRDGLPVLMAVDQLQQISGEQIDPAECIGRLTEADFKCLFAQYLLWKAPSQQEESLEALCANKG